MRLGKQERRILLYLRLSPGGSVHRADLQAKFTHFVHNVGESNGHFTWAATRKIEERLEQKGLIVFINRGRTDCRLQITEKGKAEVGYH